MLNDDDSIVSQASNIINVSNDNDDTLNSRTSEEKGNMVDDKDNEQDKSKNNTVAGKIIHHENSLSVNSFNEKKKDIPISISAGINEKKNNEVRMKIQNNNSSSSNNVQNESRKDKKRKNGDEHLFKKVPRGE